SPNPAWLTRYGGSTLGDASASVIRRRASGFDRSHTTTIGRRAPVVAISSASSRNLSSRRATSASSWPCRANMRASATPIPADAPVIRVTGRRSVMSSSPYPRAGYRKLRRPTALLKIFAWREVTREHRLLNELLWIVCPELAHLRIRLDDGVGEFSVYPRHFTDVNVQHGRAVFVEPHWSDRPVRKADIVHCLKE